MRATCGMSYSTSEIFFEEEDEVGIKLRFVYFAEDTMDFPPDYVPIVDYINLFFKPAKIEFKSVKEEVITDEDIKQDMPSFIKYNFKYFHNDSVLTIYIYGDFQPNYSNDQQSIVGAAGGIGSKFVAVKKSYINSVTTIHEILHAFSLTHTFIPTDTEGYDIYTSDKVCDTRYINNVHEKVDGNCNFIGEELLQEDEKEEIICNVMSYNHSKCRTCITEGQIRKIRFYLHESPSMHMILYKGLRNVY